MTAADNYNNSNSMYLIVFMLACYYTCRNRVCHDVKHNITLFSARTPKDHESAKIFGVRFDLEPLVFGGLKKAIKLYPKTCYHQITRMMFALFLIVFCIKILLDM